MPTMPDTLRAPPMISPSSAVSATGKRLLADSAAPPWVNDTLPDAPPPPPPAPKLQGCTPVPFGQKIVTPG